MSISLINSNNYNNQHINFKGSFNPIVFLMDGIDKGGFPASFIAQDGVGMVIPRIYEGLNRNRKKDENGKKTGPLNWQFARREGIREMLSGPSVFLIPLGMLSLIKKYSGTANNVFVNHIDTLGSEFAQFMAKNPDMINHPEIIKNGYYAKIFENVLKNSFDNNLSRDEISKYSKNFAKKLFDSENTSSKKQARSIRNELIEFYVNLRKSNVAPSENNMGAVLASQDKKLETNIVRLTQSLTDYTDDALNHLKKFTNKKVNENIVEYIGKFNKHRAGTRVLANFSMFGAVVGFFGIIPKLYNLGLKHDPGLKGLENNENNEKNNNKNNVSFTGGFSKVGETAIKKGHLGKFFEKFEFNGASMSLPGMLGLLFGFCLPTRYINAKSDKERKEILVRDILSFTSILFAAKALSRAFSGMFAKTSGLVLNIKPKNHKGFINKFKNYFTAGSGIEVLSSNQIVSKYSGIDKYKNKIIGFFDFISENNGDVKKVLKIDHKINKPAEKIVKKFSNKSLDEASLNEVYNSFKKAEGTEELDNIYKVLTKPDNKLVTRAKTLNSAFGFASTIILVPSFMMWLARFCERMTKNAVAKENAQTYDTSYSKVFMDKFINTSSK